MADNNRKVEIDAAWFAELYARANNYERIRKYCFECNIARERDELKEKLKESQKHYCTSATGKLGDACALARRCTELDDAIEAERADKLKVIKELNEVRELNRKCCDENEALKAKLSTSQNYEAVIAAKEREIAAIKEERNRLNAKVNEMKAKLDEVNSTTVVCLNYEIDALESKNKSLTSFLDDAQTKLEAAERCIEDVWNCLSPQEIADNEYAHIDIIRAYREKKEAK